MMGAGGGEPLTETALGHVARVLAHDPSGGARSKWPAELALELLLKRRAARPGATQSVTVKAKSAAACKVELQQLHASFTALAELDPAAAEASAWALELFWPPTTVAAAARKAVAARERGERGEPDDRLPVGTRVFITGLQANTDSTAAACTQASPPRGLAKPMPVESGGRPVSTRHIV
jgi:hypothetical protein